MSFGRFAAPRHQEGAGTVWIRERRCPNHRKPRLIVMPALPGAAARVNMRCRGFVGP